MAATFVAVISVVADLRAARGGGGREQDADKVESEKYIKIPAGPPVAFGALINGRGLGLVGDFFQGIGGTERILGDEAGLAGGAGGAFAQPEGENFKGGVAECAEQGGFA